MFPLISSLPPSYSCLLGPMTRIKIGRLGNKAGGTGVLWDDVTRRLHLGKSASLKKSISVFRSCGGEKKNTNGLYYITASLPLMT